MKMNVSYTIEINRLEITIMEKKLESAIYYLANTYFIIVL